MRALWFFAAPGVLLALSACGGTDESGSGSKEVVPSGPEERLESETYSLKPGEEKYLCYTKTLTEDAVITSFVPEYGPGTHHILFVQTIAPEPDGMSECPVLFKQTWLPLYAGGVKSSPLVMPEGAAVRLKKGVQLLMQLHLQNATASPISAKTSMGMKLTDPAKETIPAGIWGMDDHVIDIPPQAQDAETSMTCKSEKEMDVFGILGHMHKMGKQLDIFPAEKAEGEALVSQPWTFGEQPIVPVTHHISKGDSLTLRCRHSNTTEKELKYGESSDDEMCAAVFYYTPFDVLSGCLKVTP